MDQVSDKGKLRKIIKGLFRELVFGNEEKVLWDQKISQHIESIIVRKGEPLGSLILGVFAPLKDETSFIHYLKEKPGLRLAFPRVGEASGMDFVESTYKELKAESKNGMSFLMPSGQGKPVRPSVILVPGLAFGSKGERLGRGKGFYDRYLRDFEGLTIGCCYNFQLREDIPLDDHDQFMNYVVTEKNIINIKEP